MTRICRSALVVAAASCAALLGGCFGTGGSGDATPEAGLQPHQGYECPTALKDVQTHPGGGIAGCEITFGAELPSGWRLITPQLTAFPISVRGGLLVSFPRISNFAVEPLSPSWPADGVRPGRVVIGIFDQVPQRAGGDRTSLRRVAAADFKHYGRLARTFEARAPLFLAGRKFHVRVDSGRVAPSSTVLRELNSVLQSLTVREKLCPCRS